MDVTLFTAIRARLHDICLPFAKHLCVYRPMKMNIVSLIGKDINDWSAFTISSIEQISSASGSGFISIQTDDQNYALNDCKTAESFLLWTPFESSFQFRVSADFTNLEFPDETLYIYDLDALKVRDYCAAMTLYGPPEFVAMDDYMTVSEPIDNTLDPTAGQTE